MNIFIYRPDRPFNPNINPNYCYTLKGQNFRDWQKDQEEAYNYRVEQLKRKLSRRPSIKIEDYWR